MSEYRSKIIDCLTDTTVYTSRRYPTWESAHRAAEATCRKKYPGARYAIKVEVE